MSLSKPKAPKVQSPPPTPAPPAPSAANAPTATNDVVREVIATRKRQSTLLASSPSSSSGKTLLGSGVV